MYGVALLLRGENMKLLYAEDEVSLSEAITDVLTFHEYSVDAVYDGEEALRCALNGDYDGIILDIMMPKLSGLDVLKKLRENGCKTPVLLLTAKAEIDDRIEGLDSGADDYLVKPFAVGELMARVRAMLRRHNEISPKIKSLGNISINKNTYELCCNGQAVMLAKPEFQIMELLMLNHGMYTSTEDILSGIWGNNTDAEIGIVWVYISFLRKRLDSIGANVRIKAKRSVGYTLEVIE